MSDEIMERRWAAQDKARAWLNGRYSEGSNPLPDMLDKVLDSKLPGYEVASLFRDIISVMMLEKAQ